MKRSLSLKREQLAALSAEEMSGVNGAAAPTTPVKYCVTATGESEIQCTLECLTRGTTCSYCES